MLSWSGIPGNFRFSMTPSALMSGATGKSISLSTDRCSGLRPEKQETLVDLTDRIIRFYEDKLGIPFGSSSLAFLNTTPVSKNNSWMFVPLMLLAMEKEIGEEAMWAWMKQAINSDGQVTDYDFLLSSFSRAGIPQDTIDFLVRQYIEGENAKQHILDRL